MELIPTRKPDRGLFPLQRQMNRLFDDFFGGGSPMGNWDRGEWVPTLDIAENEEELVVSAEIPGVDPGNLEITVTGDLLTIKGEKRQENTKEQGAVHRRERSFGSFMRTVSLPSSVDPDRVAAASSNGILTIHLGKREEAKPRAISIQVD